MNHYETGSDLTNSNRETFLGMNELKETYIALRGDKGAWSYKRFYEQVARISDGLAMMMLECGCFGEQLPRGYRVIANPDDPNVLFFQKHIDLYGDGKKWYSLNAKGEEMPSRILIRGFWSDLQSGLLADIANTLKENDIENSHVAAGMANLLIQIAVPLTSS